MSEQNIKSLFSIKKCLFIYICFKFLDLCIKKDSATSFSTSCMRGKWHRIHDAFGIMDTACIKIGDLIVGLLREFEA
jgi:hypothetical protein